MTKKPDRTAVAGKLTARSLYNGQILWQRDLPEGLESGGATLAAALKAAESAPEGSVLLAMLPLTSMAASDFVVKDMRVEGLQRIAEGTVYNYLPISIGDTLDAVRTKEAVRAVYGTGLFSDIEFRRDGNTLVIAVRERPSIKSFTIEGNKDIDPDGSDRAVMEALYRRCWGGDRQRGAYP